MTTHSGGSPRGSPQHYQKHRMSRDGKSECLGGVRRLSGAVRQHIARNKITTYSCVAVFLVSLVSVFYVVGWVGLARHRLSPYIVLDAAYANSYSTDNSKLTLEEVLQLADSVATTAKDLLGREKSSAAKKTNYDAAADARRDKLLPHITDYVDLVSTDRHKELVFACTPEMEPLAASLVTCLTMGFAQGIHQPQKSEAQLQAELAQQQSGIFRSRKRSKTRNSVLRVNERYQVPIQFLGPEIQWPGRQAIGWKLLLQDNNPQLKVLGLWWGEPDPRVQATVTTHLTIDRLHELRYQCESWGGAISAVVLLQLVQPDFNGTLSNANLEHVSQAIGDITALAADMEAASRRRNDAGTTTTATFRHLHSTRSLNLIVRSKKKPSPPPPFIEATGDDVDDDPDWESDHQLGDDDSSGGDDDVFVMEGEVAPGGCQLDVMLVAEVYYDMRTAVAYPGAALKNLARLQARTPMILPLDVDMVPSSTLAYSVADDAQGLALRRRVTYRRQTLVLPSVEVLDATRAEVGKLLYGGKASVTAGLASGGVGTHRPTPVNLTHWANSTHYQRLRLPFGSSPAIIANRRHIPWADTRFRGVEGVNGLQVTAVAEAGFQFWVHPSAYVIHTGAGEPADEGATPATAKASRALLASKSRRSRGSSSRDSSSSTPMITAKDIWMKKRGALYDEAYARITRHEYSPLVGPATTLCLRALQWWR